MIPKQFKITKRVEDVSNCVTFTVKPLDKKDSCKFELGQFHMMYEFGHGAVPISISGDKANGKELVFTIQDAGGVTKHICKHQEGDVLGLRGPFGTSWPVEEAEGKDVVIMTGGIGMAPLRGLIYDMINNRKKFKDVHLLYGAQTQECYLFADELEKWMKKINVELASDKIIECESKFSAHHGFVTELADKLEMDAANTVAYICGPEPMIVASANLLVKKGVPKEKIFISMERNMKCGIGQCGRCQFGPEFTCKDGPVFPLSQVEHLLKVEEV